MWTSLRQRPGCLLLALALVVAPACSSDEPAGPSSEKVVERLVDASAITREAGTARMSQTTIMEFPESSSTAGGSVRVDAEGFLDLRNRRGRMSVTTDGQGLAGADALSGDMDIIFDGEAMYMRSPFYSQLAPDHEPWLRVTFKELGLRGASQLGQQDPLVFVEALRGVYGDAQQVGPEEIEGVETTHYRATIDVARLLSELPRDARSTVATSFEQLGLEEMPIEVWLDPEGRLRRLETDTELGDGALEGGRMQLRLELTEFGVAFELRRPPPGQVADFAEVFGETGD